jgi:quercetin dioxygenase-like cupin family protein
MAYAIVAMYASQWGRNTPPDYCHNNLAHSKEVPMAAQRPHPITERLLDAPLLTFDLAPLVAQLKGEESWHTGVRNAMTLYKGPGLRIVLIAMHANTTIPSHRADGPISVQVLEGVLTFRAEAHAVTLRAGQILTLLAGIPHVVEAEAESAFLLTMGTEVSPLVEYTPAAGGA